MEYKYFCEEVQQWMVFTKICPKLVSCWPNQFLRPGHEESHKLNICRTKLSNILSISAFTYFILILVFYCPVVYLLFSYCLVLFMNRFNFFHPIFSFYFFPTANCFVSLFLAIYFSLWLFVFISDLDAPSQHK